MISRRNIRVKVMQSLYTIDSMNAELKESEILSILNKKFKQSEQLFSYLIYFLTEVARFAETDALKKASKHLPTQQDLHINTKIAGNELLWKIVEIPSFVGSVNEYKHGHILDKDLVKKIYQALEESEEYQEYIAQNSRDKKSEKDILHFIFSTLLLPNENFIKEQIDPILEKIAEQGIQSLTREERKLLDEAKDRLH